MGVRGYLSDDSKHGRARSNLRWLALVAVVFVTVALIVVLMAFYATTFASMRPALFGDSDLLYIPSVYSDIAGGVDITGWRIPPATFFFPDFVIYALIRSLTQNMFITPTVIGVLQIGLLIGVLTLVSLQCIPEYYRNRSFAICCTMVILFFMFYDYIHFADKLLLIVYHAGVFLMSLLGFALVCHLSFAPQPKRSAGITLFVLSVLASFSDLFYVMQFIAPIGVSLVLLVWLRKLEFKRLLKSGMLIGSGFLLGYLGYALLSSNNPAFNSYLGLYSLKDAIYRYMNMADHMIRQHPIHVIFVILYIIGCVYIFVRGLSQNAPGSSSTKHGERKLLFAIYFLAGIVMTAVALAITGITIDITSFRYFLPYILLPAFLGIPLIITVPKTLPLWILDVGIICVCCFAIVISMGKIDRQQLSRNVSEEYYPAWLQCIDAHAEALDLTYGVAEYWQARPITELSKSGLRVVQVNRDLSIYYWINNLNWYDIEPEFAIINTRYPEPNARRLDEALMRERYGEPSDVFICDTSKVLVYKNNADFNNLFDEIDLN